MNVLQREQWIRERHEHWCGVLEQFVWQFRGQGHALGRPFLHIYRGRSKCAGKYWHRRPLPWNTTTKGPLCRYYTPFAILEGDKYDETIAHEVCHHYQRCFSLRDNRCQPHGDMFYFMLRYVCKFETAVHTHRCDICKAHRIAEVIALACKSSR